MNRLQFALVEPPGAGGQPAVVVGGGYDPADAAKLVGRSVVPITEPA
jgi:hypothetical protein